MSAREGFRRRDAAPEWAMPDRPEAPWQRAARALLQKRIAVVCLLVIVTLYGAGAYTILHEFGVDTGLQEPNASNLSQRRSIREVDGAPESLGSLHDAARRFDCASYRSQPGNR